MLTVGDRLPSFDLQSVVSLEKGKEFREISDRSFEGKWLVLFYWPMDFTFICPTEIARELAEALGILHKQDGVALRATFIVDPEGVIRWASVNDLSVGRSVPEVLRVLDGLQTDELCPCNWEKGQPTLEVA